MAFLGAVKEVKSCLGAMSGFSLRRKPAFSINRAPSSEQLLGRIYRVATEFNILNRGKLFCKWFDIINDLNYVNDCVSILNLMYFQVYPIVLYVRRGQWQACI